MKRTVFILFLLLPFVFAISAWHNAPEATCETPTNVRKISSTTSSMTYTWDAVSDASTYKVKYVRHSDGYQSPEWTTGSNSYTFSGLSAGLTLFTSLLFAVARRRSL